jgi:hypothetical protein
MIESSLLITAAAHLAELTDYLDLDGHLLIRNDPFQGVVVRGGCLSLAAAPERTGLQVVSRLSGVCGENATRPGHESAIQRGHDRDDWSS